jgi:hypothetical protein
MTNIPNRAIAEHLSKMSYCVSLSPVANVQFANRTSYANYPFVNNQKPPGSILNFLLLFRRLNNIGNDTENNCCRLGFGENQIVYDNKFRYIIRNVNNRGERLSYDFQYDLILYNNMYQMITGNVADGTYIFIPESYVWYLSTEHPNRTGMIVKLQARIYNSKPLRDSVADNEVPNHMLVLACLALQSGYPDDSIITEAGTIPLVNLAYMPLLCSSDEGLIKDIVYSHGFTLEFSLPIEFEVRDAERVRGISYDHVNLANAYFTSNSGLILNYIVQPYSLIRFWRI